ncbi:MAG: helix-hairpin-helix domain-containing protein [Candidatus Bathyarchaeota archaeon]|nr:MAG: helix-hairpin-helix domain-containing protein [Candidatus Bathyarchaeota archaeon]
MRSDYALYLVAVTCCVLAIITFASTNAGYLLLEPPIISTVAVAALVILGAISAGTGYLMRPEEITLVPQQHPPPRPPSAASTQPMIHPPKTAPASSFNITQIRGIGPMRAEQLRTLGINTVQDLAGTTAATLADKTELSSKIARQWIIEAKRLIRESP